LAALIIHNIGTAALTHLRGGTKVFFPTLSSLVKLSWKKSLDKYLMLEHKGTSTVCFRSYFVFFKGSGPGFGTYWSSTSGSVSNQKGLDLTGSVSAKSLLSVMFDV
jgi:hypothetical protein